MIILTFDSGTRNEIKLPKKVNSESMMILNIFNIDCLTYTVPYNTFSSYYLLNPILCAFRLKVNSENIVQTRLCGKFWKQKIIFSRKPNTIQWCSRNLTKIDINYKRGRSDIGSIVREETVPNRLNRTTLFRK